MEDSWLVVGLEVGRTTGHTLPQMSKINARKSILPSIPVFAVKDKRFLIVGRLFFPVKKSNG